MSVSSRLIVTSAFIALFGAITACSDTTNVTPLSCESNLDCSRRDHCVANRCVPLDDTVDGDAITSDDTLGADGLDQSDGRPADLGEDGVESDVVDPCEGLCDKDELCKEGLCFCKPGLSRGCGTKIGECRQGLSMCRNGQWAACEGGVEPTWEVCDGRDNNCNGITDEFVCEPPDVTCPEASAAPLGEAMWLLGAGVDPDESEVTLTWTVVAAPDGTPRQELIGTGEEVAFTPESAGTWEVQLCATDEQEAETCCETEVTAIAPCVIPALPGLSACGISWDRRPIVQFEALPAQVRYELSTADGLWATIAVTGQNYYRPDDALAGGGPPPTGAEVVISGRACMGPGDGCCSEAETVKVGLIESCTAPIAPSPDNLVFSEYLINGKDEAGMQGPTFEAGEAIELTNLSNCTVSLDAHHLRYCNKTDCSSVIRYQDFGPEDVIPPRGVFVTIRAPEASVCGFSFLPDGDSADIFGIRSSSLELNVVGTSSNNSGWFNNNGGALRFMSGVYDDRSAWATILEIPSYNGTTADCQSIGFDALGACGELEAGVIPTKKLITNQLGRLWHPCDAVVDAFPAGCF